MQTYLQRPQDGQIPLRRFSLTEVEHINLSDDNLAVAAKQEGQAYRSMHQRRHSLVTFRKDIRQRRAIASVRDGEATHIIADDNPQQVAPPFGLLDLDIHPERPNRRLPVPLLVADLEHDAVHVVTELRELAPLHLCTALDLVLAFHDALLEVVALGLQSPDLTSC